MTIQVKGKHGIQFEVDLNALYRKLPWRTREMLDNALFNLVHPRPYDKSVDEMEESILTLERELYEAKRVARPALVALPAPRRVTKG